MLMAWCVKSKITVSERSAMFTTVANDYCMIEVTITVLIGYWPDVSDHC